MKPRKLQEMIRVKEKIERGELEPAGMWEINSDGRGGFHHRAIDPKAFQRMQKARSGKSGQV